MFYNAKFKIHGFGLIEVLISVVILSIALLGLASLQSRSIQALQEGDNLVTASMIAKEMANRMMANPWVLSQGRQGYLVTDLNNEVANDGGVPNWVATTLSNNPDIVNCYSSNNSYSCFDPGANMSNPSDNETALYNMQLMDEVELRGLAWNILPEGQIKICFDSTTALTAWSCDNTATRVAARNENVFTVKVQWNNIMTNVLQMYALQFTAECPNSSGTYCG